MWALPIKGHNSVAVTKTPRNFLPFYFRKSSIAPADTQKTKTGENSKVCTATNHDPTKTEIIIIIILHTVDTFMLVSKGP